MTIPIKLYLETCNTCSSKLERYLTYLANGKHMPLEINLMGGGISSRYSIPPSQEVLIHSVQSHLLTWDRTSTGNSWTQQAHMLQTLPPSCCLERSESCHAQLLVTLPIVLMDMFLRYTL